MKNEKQHVPNYQNPTEFYGIRPCCFSITYVFTKDNRCRWDRPSAALPVSAAVMYKKALYTECLRGTDSVMLAVEEILFARLSFTGWIGFLFLEGQERRIATYCGAKLVYVGDDPAKCLSSSRLAYRQSNQW